MARAAIAHPDQPQWDRHDPVIPFIDNVMQPDVYKWSENVEWRHVPPRFRCSMDIVGYDKTGNGYTVKVKAPNGAVYRISEVDLFDILDDSNVTNNRIPEYEYKFAKQGMTYICKVVWE